MVWRLDMRHIFKFFLSNLTDVNFFPFLFIKDVLALCSGNQLETRFRTTKLFISSTFRLGRYSQMHSSLRIYINPEAELTNAFLWVYNMATRRPHKSMKRICIFSMSLMLAKHSRLLHVSGMAGRQFGHSFNLLEMFWSVKRLLSDDKTELRLTRETLYGQSRQVTRQVDKQRRGQGKLDMSLEMLTLESRSVSSLVQPLVIHCLCASRLTPWTESNSTEVSISSNNATICSQEKNQTNSLLLITTPLSLFSWQCQHFHSLSFLPSLPNP